MNHPQQNRYDAFLRGQGFIDNHPTELADIDEMPTLLLMFANIILKLQAARHQQSADTTVFAPNKDSLKIIMAAIVYKYSLRTSVKAHLIHNLPLELGLDKPITYITLANDDTAADRAFELKELMRINLTPLGNITLANITEMEEAIASFKTANPIPKEKIKDKHDFGTDLIPGLLDEADVVKNLITKLIHSYLSPELAKNWDDYITVGKTTAVRHISIAIQVTDSIGNMPLKGVLTTSASTTETISILTSDRGSARLYSLINALWDITAEYPGYISQTITNVATIEDKVAHVIIKLVKIVPPPTDENPPQPNT